MMAAAAMGVPIFFIRQAPTFGAINSKIGLLMLVAIGALVYLVALLALGGIERRELEFLCNVVRERLARGRVK
jgi:hypothetical protein